MNIKWHGQSCVSLKSKTAKIFLDPHTVGLKGKKIEADLVLSSKADIEGELEIAAETAVFTWPGEYESSKVSIHIIPFEEINILVFEVDDHKYCSLSSLRDKLPQEILEKIGEVDVLFVPIGNNEQVLGYKEAVDVIESIEPRVVIPINFQSDGSGTDFNDCEAFLKEIGKSGLVAEESYALKEVPEDRTDYVVLKVS